MNEAMTFYNEGKKIVHKDIHYYYGLDEAYIKALIHVKNHTNSNSVSIQMTYLADLIIDAKSHTIIKNRWPLEDICNTYMQAKRTLVKNEYKTQVIANIECERVIIRKGANVTCFLGDKKALSVSEDYGFSATIKYEDAYKYLNGFLPRPKQYILDMLHASGLNISPMGELVHDFDLRDSNGCFTWKEIDKG